jgi:hypothetical protein
MTIAASSRANDQESDGKAIKALAKREPWQGRLKSTSHIASVNWNHMYIKQVTTVMCEKLAYWVLWHFVEAHNCNSHGR